MDPQLETGYSAAFRSPNLTFTFLHIVAQGRRRVCCINLLLSPAILSKGFPGEELLGFGGTDLSLQKIKKKITEKKTLLAQTHTGSKCLRALHTAQTARTSAEVQHRRLDTAWQLVGSCVDPRAGSWNEDERIQPHPVRIGNYLGRGSLGMLRSTQGRARFPTVPLQRVSYNLDTQASPQYGHRPSCPTFLARFI